jgi:hypothetical protein
MTNTKSFRGGMGAFLSKVEHDEEADETIIKQQVPQKQKRGRKKVSKATINVSFFITEEEARALKDIAYWRGSNKSKILREALDAYIAKHYKKEEEAYIKSRQSQSATIEP